MTTRGRSRPERDVFGTRVRPRRTPSLGRREDDALASRFAQTPDFTVGVEEELVLVDPEDGRLVDRPDPITATMAASDGRLQTEVFASTVETTTPVCADARQMAEEVRRLRSWVVDAGEEHGLDVLATGTHPFARWEAETTTDEARYDELIHELQLPMMSDLVFGQHVHVSVGSPDEAIAVTNDMHAFLPLLLALSANAPFWRGMDTGLQSARTNVSAGMPRSGPAPAFADWEAFTDHVRCLQVAGALEDTTKLWWDVRPRPDLGTVEVRIADLPTDVDTSIGLAALTHALVLHLARCYRRGERPEITQRREFVRENRWRALRNGLEAEFVDRDPNGEPRVRSVAQTFARTVDMLSDAIDELAVGDAIEHLQSRVDERRTGADRQRSVYAREGDLSAVVRDLVDRTPP